MLPPVRKLGRYWPTAAIEAAWLLVQGMRRYFRKRRTNGALAVPRPAGLGVQQGLTLAKVQGSGVNGTAGNCSEQKLAGCFIGLLEPS